MNKVNPMKKENKISFEDIKHIDLNGNEFWYARELQEILEYTQWRNFKIVIAKAKKSCVYSRGTIIHDFANASKIVEAGATSKKIEDYKLSRYACYLIDQNGDSRKENIALAQTYFAIQTINFF